MRLASRILPGALHDANRGSCDWGWQGFLAYGCQNFVVVLDPQTMQVVQTLHYYTSPVVKVRWVKQNYYHDTHSPYDLVLASGNQAGQVIIWDVKEAKILSELAESGRNVLEMEWLKHVDVSQDLLMVLHAPGILILWNTNTGVRLWRKSFQDTLMTFALDPFEGTTLAVMSQEWIMFLKDFNTVTPPADKGRKFYMTAVGIPSNTSYSSNKGPGKSSQSKSAIQKVRSWAGDMRGRSEDESFSTCDCLQIAFLPSAKNNFLLLFPRDILVLDLELGQTIGSFAMENTSPSFLEILGTRQHDALFCLHENGSVTLRVRRAPEKLPYHIDKNNPNDGMSSKVTADIVYDAKCQSDVFRISRSSRLMGFCMNPVSERDVAVLLSDGKIFIWKLVVPSSQQNYRLPSPSFTLSLQPVKSDVKPKGPSVLSGVLPPILSFEGKKPGRNGRKLKFLLNGIFEGVGHNPVCMKMCPPLTTKNWAFYKLLVAVGCFNGVIQIYNLADGSLFKEYAIHGTAVKGIEWISLVVLLSFAHSSTNTAKSEIQMVDIKTGHTVLLPTSRGLQDSYVADLKVSHRKQYLLILFKNHSAELWDAVTLTQLREFPADFPSLTAFEWSPPQYSTKFKKRQAAKAEALPALLGNDATPNVLDSKPAVFVKKSQAFTKEHLVYTDTDGVVYHYVVEGTTLKDGSKVPPESGMGTISYITWKADMVVLGDVDGIINLWDLKARVSRVFPSHRGIVKRLKFAPGKGNMRLLVLYNDGIDIWDTTDVTEATIVNNLKTQKDQATIVDADWMGSDMPLLLISDGSIRVLDPALKSANSTMQSRDNRDFVFSPRLLESEVSLYLKSILQHQAWHQQYSLDSADLFDAIDENRELRAMIDNLPSLQKALLYSSPSGTAQRCKAVAQLFGDESDTIFWSVALHYLQREQLRMSCSRHKDGNYRRSTISGIGESLSHRSGSSNTLDLDSISDIIESEAPSNEDVQDCFCLKTSLDAGFDIFCDNDYFQKLQLYRIALRDSRRVSAEQTRACAEKLTLIGETDRAVQLLLETDPKDPGLYCDGLRACLIATVKSSGASQSTIKLVATNLIANGKISEGVELLCLVDKAADACRYLQTYGNWELSTWLAKVSLCQQECNKVLTRWAEHLLSSQVNRKNKAVLVLLSLGKFIRVLEVLFSLGQVDRAVLLYEACLEFNILTEADETHAILFENIIIEYARLQLKLKNIRAFKYYCGKAGGRGKKLLDEFNESQS